MSKKYDRLLGHGDENDGIDEYDNPLPDWWLGLFAVSIVYGIGYGVYYHFIAGDSQVKRYEAEMAAAAQLYPEQEAPETLSYDEATLAAGEAVFTTTCVSCHAADMTGGIGPNLIDAEWRYGNTERAVVESITSGRPAGMPPWGPALGAEKVAQVAAYVLHKAGGPGPDDGPAPADAAPAPADAAPADAGNDGLASADPAGTAEPIAPPPGELDGATIFAQKCASCHSADMTGLVGPNLIDAEWIHGGTLDDITRTITVGVPEKGMIAWSTMMSAEEIDVVARYVHQRANE
jgi:cytochrome c oxidase cbb3-type subunit 3